MSTKALPRLLLTSLSCCLISLPVLAETNAAHQDASEKTAQEALPKATEIFDRFVEVTGGKEAYAKHTSRTSKGSWELAGAGIKGQMTMYQAAPAMIYVQIDVPGIGQLKQGFNGTVGWTMNPMTGAMLQEGKELSQAKRESTFNLVAHMAEQFATTTTEEKIEFDGEMCYRVKLVSKEGDVSQAFYSVDSGLFRGMKMTAPTPQGDIPTTSTFRDYKEFGGIKVATVNVISAMGQQQTLTQESIEFNNVDPSVFVLPAAIQTLVKAAEDKKDPEADKPAS